MDKLFWHRSLRYYLDKYHLFVVTGSLGMDDTYGRRLDAFRRLLERNLGQKSLGWCKLHFHSIGDGYATSLEHFRSVLELVKQHEQSLWITGLADAYKYLTARRGAKLQLTRLATNRLKLALTCATEPTLYDQPLTIELTVPASWAGGVVVTDAAGRALQSVRQAEPDLRAGGTFGSGNRALLRFDVPPRSAEYVVELPQP